MNLNDKRVLKTKRLIKNSLADLLCEKKLENITIKELTDRISISRNTFYAHYLDIYDLYDKIEDELYTDITNILSENPDDTYQQSLITMIDYIYSNSSIMKAFLCSSENYHFRMKLADYFEQLFTKITLYEMDATHMKEDWKYLVKYHSSGVVACFAMWIDSNFAYPKDKLLQMIMDIDSKSDCLYV